MNADTDNGYESRIPLVLGTAQLGMEYGIANIVGKPDLDTAFEIVKTAWESGIRFFDTAQAYGDSEEVLGKCFKELEHHSDDIKPAVISKIQPKIKPSDVDKILGKIDETIEKLGYDNLYGLLFHRESWLEKGVDFIRHIVPKLKSENKIKNFGVSIYSPKKAIEALNMDEIDIIQLPFNVFDQRALENDIFHLADERGKKIFIRSIYLQGLLLLDDNQVPDKLTFSKEARNKYNDFCKNHRVSPKLLALAFVINKAPNALIVIGSENPRQVKENILLLKRAKKVNLPDLSFLSTDDPKLINPSLWPH